MAGNKTILFPEYRPDLTALADAIQGLAFVTCGHDTVAPALQQSAHALQPQRLVFDDDDELARGNVDCARRCARRIDGNSPGGDRGHDHGKA